jgi:cytosine permease
MKDKTVALLEDYGSSPVPADQGKGWFQIGIVYWGVAVCLPAFLISGIIAGPTRLGTAIAAFIAASVVLSAVAVLTGVIGAQTKLSTGLSANFTFGKYGAYILQIVLFFAAWGWFGVQLGFMAEGLGDGGLAFVTGGTIPVPVLKIIGGLLMTLTAMVGFKAIEKLSAVAIPLLLIMLIATIISVYSGEKTLASVANITTEFAMPFGVAVSIIIGSFIMGAIIAPDVTRYAKTKNAAGIGMAFGMLIGFPVVLILASIMVKGAGGEIDFSKVMLSNNSGFWTFMAVLTIILAAWTTNDNNLYSGALAINAMFPKLHKWVITVFSGALGTILALLGINTSAGFQTFLSFLAIIIPPAAAVMMVDYLFFKNDSNKEYRGEELQNLSNLRIVPVVCWVAGVAVGLLVQYTSLSFTTITAVDTIIAAAVVYFVAMTVVKKKSG